ncbi:hypothetical protein J2S78_002082 [Salibacterium salarium]|uniref:hypothetical protein n=1 Tax=Salibacterium salarium TaxID=284579 RepID=UPI0027897268|nr:hypothetical protein [Salibacterium salarium]MDQ0299662.1 hypothetical protein [Salibacterium salarium]
MNDVTIGVLTAAITIFITNLFSYWFAIKKEEKKTSIEYKIDIIKNVYAPIAKVIEKKVVATDGYEGITYDQLLEIEKIIEENHEYVDAELYSLLWGLKEDFIIHEQIDDYFGDEDREFLEFAMGRYNDLRENVGLPPILKKRHQPRYKKFLPKKKK